MAKKNPAVFDWKRFEAEVISEDAQVWHVVTSQGGAILGVFGSALLSDAQECARRVEAATGFPAFLSQRKGPRPMIGGGF